MALLPDVLRLTGSSDAAAALRADPVLNHNFVVSLIDTSSTLAILGSAAMSAIFDVALGGFSECSGLEMSLKTEDYREATRAFDGTFNRWFLDPLFGRGYPADVIEDHVKAKRIESATLPFRPTPFHARFELTLSGAKVPVVIDVANRYEGNIFSGEKRMPPGSWP